MSFFVGVGLWILGALIVAKIMYTLHGRSDADRWIASMLMFWPIFAIGLFFIGGFKFLIWVVKF